jgi:hypothetical protein
VEALLRAHIMTEASMVPASRSCSTPRSGASRRQATQTTRRGATARTNPQTRQGRRSARPS